LNKADSGFGNFKLEIDVIIIIIVYYTLVATDDVVFNYVMCEDSAGLMYSPHLLNWYVIFSILELMWE